MIPTLRRPELLLRALRSVIEQTVQDIEIIVVVDGRDEGTVTALRTVCDPRLAFIVNPRSLNAAGSRNVGVAQAKGDWIAFLDDDDVWLPQKLEKQLGHARNQNCVLVSCLSRVITPNGTYIRPATVFDNSCPIDDYLFDRRTVFGGTGLVQTSSYLMARSLYEKSPFRVDSPHDDWDFLLRLTKQIGARVETVPEVLVNLYFEEQRPSLSQSGSWIASLAWADSIRSLFTRRAYSGFCLGVVGSRAANEQAYAAFFPLLYRACRYGRPRLRHVMPYLAFWILPQRFRRKLRAWFQAQPREAVHSEALK